MHVDWQGVFPAATTQFKADQSLDVAATLDHVDAMIEAGIDGLIMLGTVGENCSLEAGEKREILRATVEHVAGRVPVLSGVAEYTTALARRFAKDAEEIGVDGLMVLPAMVYKSDARETIAHYRAVARASGLPIMCYNNPVSYGVDISPESFAELADEPTLVAIKESSENPRRITDLRNAVGDRYILFCGVDDLVLESIVARRGGLGLGPGERLPARESPALGPRHVGPVRGGPRGLSLVHPAAPPRHPPEARPVHQARRERVRLRYGDGPRPAAADRRRGARADPRPHPQGDRHPPDGPAGQRLRGWTRWASGGSA